MKWNDEPTYNAMYKRGKPDPPIILCSLGSQSYALQANAPPPPVVPMSDFTHCGHSTKLLWVLLHGTASGPDGPFPRQHVLISASYHHPCTNESFSNPITKLSGYPAMGVFSDSRHSPYPPRKAARRQVLPFRATCLYKLYAIRKSPTFHPDALLRRDPRRVSPLYYPRELRAFRHRQGPHSVYRE